VPTEFGFTAPGEYLPVVAEPWLRFEVAREDLEDLDEGAEYLILGARALGDRWTVRMSYVRDAVVCECWVGRV
jgi:hypothetical protein